MISAVKDLFASKKALVMFAAILLSILKALGIAIDPDTLKEVLAMMGAYIVGQGIADHGKEAAKIAAANPAPPTVVNTNINEPPSAGAAGAGAAVMLTILMLGGLGFGALSAGCVPTQNERADTLHITLVATDSAHAALVAYDAQHQAELVAEADTKAGGRAALDDYRTKRDNIEHLVATVYAAIGAAAQLNDAKSLGDVAVAAINLHTAITALTGGTVK